MRGCSAIRDPPSLEGNNNGGLGYLCAAAVLKGFRALLPAPRPEEAYC
jgi:hypothetical protein